MTNSNPELHRCLDARHKFLLWAGVLSVAVLLSVMAMQQLSANFAQLGGKQADRHQVFAICFAFLFLANIVAWSGYIYHRLRQRSYVKMLATLNNALHSENLSFVQSTVATAYGSLYLCEACMQNAKARAQLPGLAPYKGRRNPADALLRRISGSAFSGKRR